MIPQRSQQAELKERKHSIICSHCMKLGHFIDKCYKIIGFLVDFKFTKGSKAQVGGKGGPLDGTLATKGFSNITSRAKQPMEKMPAK